MKTSRFVARYIRDVSRNRTKRSTIMKLLENDQPFDEETVGAVALIDISGFTALTSTLLAQQGRRSSEEMTQAVSKFMSKIIDIISYYGGDVIKFLGDALLIVFEAKSASAADLRYTTRRALICCTEVLIKGKTKILSPLAGSPTKKKTFEVDEDLLDLHIGLSAGPFHHVIVGVAGQRCDYFVHGPPLGEIGGALDNARPGELGIAKSAVEVLELPESIYSQIKIRKYETKGGSQTCEFKSLELLQSKLIALEPPRMDFLEDNRRKVSGTAFALPTESTDIGEEIKQSDAFCFQFMNQSLVRKVKNLQNSDRLGSPISYNMSSKLTLASLAPSASQSAITSMSAEEDEIISNKFGPSSEYRRVTIMFIKFRFSYTKMRAHQLFSVLIKGLMPYDGVTQQFSVDDKGQSFFAVFGLPPWSHENNAMFAVRAAITVSDMLKNQGLTPFTIGLSTGDLLFSHMGSKIRSEAGLLGDVVNVAARLMIFNKAEGYNIFCDYDTHEATSEMYQHSEIGLHMLKGKLEPVSIWAIKNSKSGIDNLKINHKDKRSLGYAEEKAKINSIFTKWMKDKQQAVLIVEGPSGVGKTSLLENALTSMAKNDAKMCVIRGSEIEKMNSLFPIKQLMRTLYQIFGRLNETDKAAMTKMNAPEIPFVSTISTPQLMEANVTTPQIVIESASPGSPLPVDNTGKSQKLQAGVDVPGEAEGKSSVTAKKSQRKGARKPAAYTAAVSVDESIEGMKKFFIACGQNPDYISILAPVMEWLREKAETPATRDLEPGTRQEMLKHLVTNIMKAMSETVKIAILVDDLQFMDTLTLDILCSTVKETTKTLYFLFSRPFTIYKLTAIQNLRSLSFTTHIALNGLSLQDTQKMLVWKFRDIGAMSIDKEFLRVIHARSSGSPFFLDKVADTLLATLPRVIACDEKGVVSTAASGIDYQEILALNVESAILVTFDQLDHHMQEILRVASVFGMHFDFTEISAVIDGSYPPEDLIEMAQSLDQFTFLMPSPSDYISQQNVPEDRKKYQYCFTHMLICNTIYGSQSFGHRQEIHRRIATYLEDQITTENQSSVLSAIAFHYSNTSDQEKMYIYFEKLGLHCVEKFMFQEGIGALGRLIFMYESEKKNESGAQIEPLRQAAWYSALAFAESGKKQIKNARKNALKALALIESYWPETDAQYNNLMKESSRKHNKLWVRTVGGRYSLGGEPNLEKDKIMFRCFSVLHTLASIDPSLPPKDLPLANLNHMNLSISCSQYRPEFVDGCLKSAEWHWISKNKYFSNIYLQQGTKLSSNLVDFDSFLYSAGALAIYKGDFIGGLDNLTRCAESAKRRKDMATFHLNQVFIATTLMTVGKIEESYKAAIDNCKEVENHDLHVMTLFYSVAMELSSVFLDKMEESSKYAALVMSKSDYVVTPLTKVFLGSCAIFHLRKGDYSRALERFQDMINSGMTLMTAGQHFPMQLFGYCAIWPFLYFSSAKDLEESKQSLIDTLTTAVAVAKKLWMLPCMEGAAAYQMYLAALLLFQGKLDLSMGILQKALQGAVLNNMVFIRGLHLAALSRFATNVNDKKKFVEEAVTILEQAGARGLAEWAKGSDFSFK